MSYNLLAYSISDEDSGIYFVLFDMWFLHKLKIPDLLRKIPV
jgi:hypothetical protein